MSALPRCAVVIPTFNGAHLLTTCLESLFAHPPERCEMEVVVVDDASADGTVERFADHEPALKLLSHTANRGFAISCNDGAAAAGDDVDYLVFLNNDTVPLPGWLDALVDEAEADPELGAVGSKLLYPDGTVQHAGVMIGQDRWPRHLYAGFPGDHSAVERSRPVAAATAACLLVRRGSFAALGGFDIAYVNGYEDIDLCLRLTAERGETVRYCARSVLYHLESVTRWSDARTAGVAHNSRIFEERWHDRIEPDDLTHYVADGLIRAEYGAVYPLSFWISPLLAAVHRETGPEDRLERLLTVRTDQVFDLQAERIRAALDHRRAEIEMPSAEPPPRPRTGGSPEIVNRGGFQTLKGGPGRHRVSVLMPLMDAGEALRRILPRLLEQDAAAELEVVAVDSASRDDTIAVLEEFDATAIAIDPSEFDHGLTRNLLAEHARGDVLVYLNEGALPCDDGWLAPLLAALDNDAAVAGVTSRIVPHPEADRLTRHDIELEPSGADRRSVRRVDHWEAYEAMPVEQRRLLLNFHSVSAAIRADVMRQFPFKSVRAIGEDLLWAREVVEAGMALVHEPGSKVFHSHDYSLREWFMRNVDDGVANREINGRLLADEEADALVRGMIAADWAYLRDELGLEGEELERWQIQAALRRAAQTAGQWLGVRYKDYPDATVDAFSRIANSRRKAP
jgi:GT2 family glycosyltransferase